MSEEQTIKIISELAELKTLAEDTHHRLFGNGQPGLIKEIGDRLVQLETTEAKRSGGLRVLTFLGSFLGVTEIGHILYSLFGEKR